MSKLNKIYCIWVIPAIIWIVVLIYGQSIDTSPYIQSIETIPDWRWKGV